VATEVRIIDGPPWTGILQHGTYAFRTVGEWHALAVFAGQAARPEDQGRFRFTDGGHLVIARSIHEKTWATATRVDHDAGPPAFAEGDVVRPRGGTGFGRVRQVIPTERGHRYRVDVDGVLKSFGEESLERFEGDPRSPEFWLTQDPVGAKDLALTLTWTKLRHPLTDTIYSFASSKTLFRAYQFKPVLKVLTGSAGRLLIADEVGLGKTIEAGLIWSELEQRMPLSRVLVVVPAALTYKWKAEMERRFDRRLPFLRPVDLEDFAHRLGDTGDAEIQGVISLESLRIADRVLARLNELQPRLDLVIVDEAHDLRNRGTRSHALGSLLSDWADYLIFLSATPLNLGNLDLFNLVNLLDEGNFGDRVVFQSQLEPNAILNDVAKSLSQGGRTEPRKLAAKLDELHGLQFGSTVTGRPDFEILRGLLNVDRSLTHAEEAHARRLIAELNTLGSVLSRTRKIDVPNEKAVREPRNIDVDWTDDERQFYDVAREWYMQRARENGTPPGFATQMPLRQIASCIPAAYEVLRRRETQLFRTEMDDVDEDIDAADLNGLDLTALTRLPAVDTKYIRLLEELRRVRAAGIRQVMIFSFFKGTLKYLASRLYGYFSVRVMDGDTPMDQRPQLMDDFRRGDFEILLLSQVGAEGLDFEFCNVLVNYDLPWNPMEVEQRIGRLDRFGQKSEKIFIYNMRVPGTIETDIFQRLYDRIDLFQRSIGELEPILRDEIGLITRKLLDPRLDANERQMRTEQMAVAWERRAQDAARLENSRAVLSGIDNLLVDGLTESGPGNGRFIGPTEIQTMLGELLRRTGGRQSAADREGVFVLIGSRQLSSALLGSRVPEGGTRHSRAKLASLLRDGEPLAVTLSTDAASRHDVDLLSSRHPLVKLAMEVLSRESLELSRFGSVAVPGLAGGRRYLVNVDLAETTGLRPLLELWATAVDVVSREIDPDVGDLLLTALAEGRLRDASLAVPDGLMYLWHLADVAAESRRYNAERQRAKENAALVEGRILAQEESLDLKISKVKDLLEGMRQSAGDASIRRLHEGRLRNLRSRREAVADSLLPKKELSLSLTPVAVVLVSSTDA
jgi:superfamily II DNA or RNA helicase